MKFTTLLCLVSVIFLCHLNTTAANLEQRNNQEEATYFYDTENQLFHTSSKVIYKVIRAEASLMLETKSHPIVLEISVELFLEDKALLDLILSSPKRQNKQYWLDEADKMEREELDMLRFELLEELMQKK